MEVTLQSLTKTFGEVTAVDSVSLKFRDGKLTGLLGPSGCGKSTMLYMIAGLQDATAGRILFGERDVTSMMPEKRNIGLVFQNYALYPLMTVAEICIALNKRQNPVTKKSNKLERRAAAVDMPVCAEEDLMDRNQISFTVVNSNGYHRASACEKTGRAFT